MESFTDRAITLSPNTSIQGRSQAQLGDRWWQTVYAIAATNHFGLFDDSTDPRGRRGSVEKASQGQLNASTQLIGGGFGELTTNVDSNGLLKIQRTIVLPNKGWGTVFLPILNASFDNLVNDPNDTTNLTGNLTGQQLQQKLKTLFSRTDKGGWVSSLFASVDGRSVKLPDRYRQASPTPFSYTAPFPTDAGLLSSGGYNNATYLDNADAPAIQLQELAKGDRVSIAPAVSDGYWLAVEIRGGAHTLNFGGSLSDQGTPFFSLETTYNLLNPISGSTDIDRLTGTKDKDCIKGFAGNDWLLGWGGDDLLLGGKGRDVLHGGRGDDELWGDRGVDTFLYRKGDGKDTLFDFSRGETVRLEGGGQPVAIRDVVLASGLQATQIDFGAGDMLTFVAVQSSDLTLQNDLISYA